MSDILAALINKEKLDEYIQNHKETNQEELDRLQALYDEKCDEVRESLEENGRLRLLLDKHGVEHVLE